MNTYFTNQASPSPRSSDSSYYDLLESIPEEEIRERAILEALRENVRSPRRHQKLTKEEIIFVETVG